MAERPSSPTASDALQKLEEQLACPACQERFEEPRTLPCQHSFCLSCLQQIPLSIQGGKYIISCPSCSQPARLPDNGATDFPPALLINNFLNVRTLLQRVTGRQATCDICHKVLADGFCRPCSQFFCKACIIDHRKHPEFSSHEMSEVEDMNDSSVAPVTIPPPVVDMSPLPPTETEGHPVMMCEIHDIPLDLFCDNCEELLCTKCTGRHEGHSYDLVENVFDRHKKEIEDSLKPVKEKKAMVDAALTALNRRAEEIAEQGQAVKRQIHDTMQQMVQELRDAERLLTHQVDTEVQEKLEVLDQERDEAHYKLAQLLLTVMVVLTHHSY